MRYILLFFAIFAAVAIAAEIPCVVTQVDGALFPSGARVPVFAVSSRTANCPASPFVDRGLSGEVLGTTNILRYTIDRFNPAIAEWERVGEQRVGSVVSGSDRRTELFTLTLADGRYRLTTVNGDVFLEALHFTVGGIGEDTLLPVATRPDLQVPYLCSARVASGGYLYFRGYLGGNRVALGYLYQLRKGRTEVLPVEFEEVHPQDTSVFVNQPFLRGGMLDPPWVRVRLPNNSLDPNRPVYASITRDGGGATVQGVVFNPMASPAHYTGGFGGEYRITSR